MLKGIRLENVGPAAELELPLATRLNVIAGDNGLGKSFILDLAWWAITRTWSSHVPRPRVMGRESSVSFAFDGSPSLKTAFDRQTQVWEVVDGLPQGDPRAVVVYLRPGGEVSTWDWARNGRADGQSYPHAYHFGPKEVWEGLSQGGALICEGLERDWLTWRRARSRQYDAMNEVAAILSPPGEVIAPWRPQRVFANEARDRATIKTGGEVIPLVSASAGIRRVLSLAYILVWAWHEHRAVCELKGLAPAESFVLLIDEPEAHLHPKWQRSIVPSALSALKNLAGANGHQMIAATHAPLVLASIEPLFDTSRDMLTVLDREEGLRGGGVMASRVDDWMQGTASSWLVSDVFGLRQARSREAEEAIEAAEALMRGDPVPNPELGTKEMIHASLQKLLPDSDPFWPRWLVTQRLLDTEP